MVIGATLLVPNAAQAACTGDTSGNPDTITCTSANSTAIAGTTISNTTTNDGAVVNIGNPPGTNLNINSTVGVTIGGTGTGGVAVHVNGGSTNQVTIQPTASNTDAISVTASANTRSNAITIDTSTYTTLDTYNGTSSAARDGIRVLANGTTAVSSPITITSASTIIARQDGIHVEEKGAGSSGKLTVTSTGAITAGYQGGSSGDVDWNAISVEGNGSNIEINTSGAGTITMESGNQAAIWSKTISGDTEINVGANITGTAQTSASRYGAGVMALTGGGSGSSAGGEVSITNTAAINVAGDGILIGQFHKSDNSDTGLDKDITVTSSGKITSTNKNGIEITGFTDTGGVWHDTQLTSYAADSDITITTESGGQIEANGSGGKGIAINARGGTSGTRADNDITLGDTLQSSSTGIDITSTNGNVTITTLAGDTNVNSSEGGDDASTDGGSIYSRYGSGIVVSAGGAFTLTNSNHIEGAGGDGVNASGGTFASITNNSLNSIISGGVDAAGIDVGSYDQVYFDNRGALTAGVGIGATGAYIHDISGDGVTEGGTVVVDNTYSHDSRSGGIIVGTNNGLIIDGVGSPSEGGGDDVYVDNSGGFQYWHKREGGFIAGLGSEGGGIGVGVYGTEGDVTIDNSLTRNWRSNSLSESDIDPQVGLPGGILGQYPNLYSGYILGMPQMASYLGLSDEFENGTGIWGLNYGVQESNIGGHAYIDNSRGLIVGMNDGSVGVSLSNVGDGVEIDNSSWAWAGRTDDYSLILGSGKGIDLTNIWGGVDIYNQKGIVYAHGGNAITITGSSEGDNNIENKAGAIVSYYGNAIQVSEADGDVYINNADEDDDTWGGVIVGGKSAIVVGDAENVGARTVSIYNGRSWWDHNTHSLQGGLIAGGDVSESGSPVIYLHTQADTESDGAYIENQGIIGNLGPNPYNTFAGDNIDDEFDSYLPGVGIPGSLSEGTGDLKWVYRNAAKISSFARSAGQSGWGSIDYLSDFAGAAGSAVVVAEGGATGIENDSHGIIFGTIDLAGRSNYWDDGSVNYSSYVYNYGKWFTLGDNYVRQASESEESFIQNDGFIQTAFQTEGGDNTTFHVTSFYNDSEDVTGYVSMIDGDADDHTTFDGNFYGSMSEGELSFLAIDAYLASSESGDAKGDLYTITGNAYGTTGLIVHNLNSGVSDGSNVPGIKVIEVQNEAINHCQSSTDNACKEGDAFFIASATPNYENIAGFGTIRDGLYSWILQERDGESEGSSDFYLVSQASPDGQNQASSLTSLTTAWFDTAGYVDDHDYGGQLDQNNGGSGADPVTGSSMHSVLWGRINGTWSKRDTTVVDNSIPIDTSANQNVYGVTAGLEMRPNGGDSNTRVGVYGGYLASNTSFDAYSGKSKASGGLVGGYLAFTNGNGWYVDGEVKADFVNLTYQSPYVTIDTKGRTIGFLANTGYRMQNGANFFEPILSFAYANTQVDDATVGTTTVDYSAGNSIRAGVGARVGTTVGAPGAVQTELDLTAKVWDEFGQPNSVTIDDTVTPNPVTVTDDIAGLFGEVTGRATVYNADRTGSGFLSIGGRFGSNSTTITAKAGLRKNF